MMAHLKTIGLDKYISTTARISGSIDPGLTVASNDLNNLREYLAEYRGIFEKTATYQGVSPKTDGIDASTVVVNKRTTYGSLYNEIEQRPKTIEEVLIELYRRSTSGSTGGSGSGINEAPEDGLSYIRKDAGWANLSPSSIKILYEANHDTNVFTDDDRTKLDLLENSPSLPEWIHLDGTTSHYDTGVSGARITTDTTLGPVVIRLNDSPEPDSAVRVVPIAPGYNINSLTIQPGPNPINGTVQDIEVTTNGQVVELVFANSSTGWVLCIA